MITLTATFAVPPETLYQAWLTGTKHAAMTGAKATGSAKVGGKFTAWDGYIWGKNLELVKDKKIVQSWRTSEFAEDAPDSILTITLVPTTVGTKLRLQHQGTPHPQESSYRQGWEDHYFAPMRVYFS